MFPKCGRVFSSFKLLCTVGTESNLLEQNKYRKYIYTYTLYEYLYIFYYFIFNCISYLSTCQRSQTGDVSSITRPSSLVWRHYCELQTSQSFRQSLPYRKVSMQVTGTKHQHLWELNSTALPCPCSAATCPLLLLPHHKSLLPSQLGKKAGLSTCATSPAHLPVQLGVLPVVVPALAEQCLLMPHTQSCLHKVCTLGRDHQLCCAREENEDRKSSPRM